MSDKPNTPVTHFEHLLLERCADLEERARLNQLSFEAEVRESTSLRREVAELRSELRARSMVLVERSQGYAEAMGAIQRWLRGIINQQASINQNATAIRVLLFVVGDYQRQLPEYELLPNGAVAIKDDIPF